MTRSIKEMDKGERWSYIKFPLILVASFIFGAVVLSLAIYSEGQPYGVYMILGAFTFLTLFFVTSWWEAMKNWKNGGTWKRKHPKEWKELQEERKMWEIERKKKK